MNPNPQTPDALAKAAMSQALAKKLKGIAVASRRSVGVVNSESAFSEALATAMAGMVKAAKQVGVINAGGIAKTVAEQLQSERAVAFLLPGRRFRVFRDAIVEALVAALPDLPAESDPNTGDAVVVESPVAASPELCVKSYLNTGKIGKRSELRVFAQMIEDGLDVYIPLVDDHGVDAVVCWKNGLLLRVQVKSRESSVRNNYAKFRIRFMPEKKEGLFFVFYSKRLSKYWLMSAEEFVAATNGRQAIDFLGQHRIISDKYAVENFDRLKDES